MFKHKDIRKVSIKLVELFYQEVCRIPTTVFIQISVSSLRSKASHFFEIWRVPVHRRVIGPFGSLDRRDGLRVAIHEYTR
jgi:hypothetical protein